MSFVEALTNSDPNRPPSSSQKKSRKPSDEESERLPRHAFFSDPNGCPPTEPAVGHPKPQEKPAEHKPHFPFGY